MEHFATLGSFALHANANISAAAASWRAGLDLINSQCLLMISILRFFFGGLVRGAIIENVLILISAARFQYSQLHHNISSRPQIPSAARVDRSAEWTIMSFCSSHNCWKTRGRSSPTQLITAEIVRTGSSKTKCRFLELDPSVLQPLLAPLSHFPAFPRRLRSAASFLKKNRRLLYHRPPPPPPPLPAFFYPPLPLGLFFFMAGFLTHDLCHALDCMYASIHKQIKPEQRTRELLNRPIVVKISLTY